MEYQQLQVEQKRKKEKEAKARSDAKAAQLEKVALIFDKNIVTNLKGQKLVEQVDAFYHFGAPLGLRKDIRVVADKRIALKLAIDEYNSGKWVPKSKSASEGEDGNAGNVDVDEEEE